MRKCLITSHCAEGDKQWDTQKQGWFHCLCTENRVIPPSAALGGHQGGQVSYTLAVVEDSKHRLQKVDVGDVQFCDEPDNGTGRPCEYFVKSNQPNLGIKDEGEWKKGTFLQWTVDYEQFESGPGMFPEAIIEDEDGGVQLVYAKYVRFPKGDV